MARRCLILGSANNLFDDVENALSMSEFEGVVAAKRAGVLWPGRLDAFVTLHPDRLTTDLKERESLGYQMPERVFSHVTLKAWPHVTDRIDYLLGGQRTSGSSGLFAVLVAQSLGFTKCVLCGIPLDEDFGKLGTVGKWTGRHVFRQGFLQMLPSLKTNTRSMSGFTAQHLGTPTPDWLLES